MWHKLHIVMGSNSLFIVSIPFCWLFAHFNLKDAASGYVGEVEPSLVVWLPVELDVLDIFVLLRIVFGYYCECASAYIYFGFVEYG